MSHETRSGDFTDLAENYSKHRPDYCPTVLNALLGLQIKPISDIDFVDVGAGTGIWTRMVFKMGVGSLIAIEPNDDMRRKGMADCQGTPISWHAGSAEATKLTDGSADWITMASSFHWAQFNRAMKEFYRVLRPSGWFTAIWNPRLVEVNPLLAEIEHQLSQLKPDLKRISSGRSGITEDLTERLWASPYFNDVVYLEGRHVIQMDPNRYLGIWRSVNDVRSQLGAKQFDAFIKFVESRVAGLEIIEVTYLTRAWSARRIS